jgi:OmpA-OmpF porin, OOP family
MEDMQRSIEAVFIVIFIAGTTFASEIRHMNYSYAYEFAKGVAEPAFVVCDNCPPRKSLARLLKTAPTVIALRVSEPYPVKPQHLSANVKQEEREKQQRAATDTSLTVHFDFDSFTLRPEEREKLQAAPSVFKGAVTVTGYTCDIGAREYNRKLSLKRAEEVAKQLRQIGVPPSEVAGKGECCPVSDKKELNRRVDIKEVR